MNRRRARRLTLQAVLTWRFLFLTIITVVVCAGSVGALYASMRLTGAEVPAGLTGFVVGVFAASVPWFLWVVVTGADGSASWRVGADAEGWTDEQLRRIGPDWRLFNNVPFAAEFGRGEIDVDHIAVGPYGVLVVETKWTTQPVVLDAKRSPEVLRQAVRQVEGNRGRVLAALGRDFADVPVIAVVVLWGRRVERGEQEIRRIGDVRIVRGQDGREWRRLLQGVQRVDGDVQDAVAGRLGEVIRRYETQGHASR